MEEYKEKLLAKLKEEYPLMPHTGVGRLYTMVRRMKAEKELGAPMDIRSGFAISVETGKAANKMTEDEWEKFYQDLCEQLKNEFPSLYYRLFPEKENI